MNYERIAVLLTVSFAGIGAARSPVVFLPHIFRPSESLRSG
jgi:hypothetical protein